MAAAAWVWRMRVLLWRVVVWCDACVGIEQVSDSGEAESAADC